MWLHHRELHAMRFPLQVAQIFHSSLRCCAKDDSCVTSVHCAGNEKVSVYHHLICDQFVTAPFLLSASSGFDSLTLSPCNLAWLGGAALMLCLLASVFPIQIKAVARTLEFSF